MGVGLQHAQKLRYKDICCVSGCIDVVEVFRNMNDVSMYRVDPRPMWPKQGL